MLTATQEDGRLQKVSTDNVIMIPTLNSQIQLDQLNVMIAEQKNIAVDDLAYLVSGAVKPNSVKITPPSKAESPVVENAVLTDKDLAKNYRSQADALYKEAAKLRKQADELDPLQKKTSTKSEISAEAVVQTA
jgi:hypothetical protein